MSPTFVASLRWSHKIRDITVVAYLSGVLVRNIIYNILLDACNLNATLKYPRHEEIFISNPPTMRKQSSAEAYNMKNIHGDMSRRTRD
jgi:hypothetical protein